MVYVKNLLTKHFFCYLRSLEISVIHYLIHITSGPQNTPLYFVTFLSTLSPHFADFETWLSQTTPHMGYG